MLHRSASFLCLCIAAMQLLQVLADLPVDPDDPEIRAQFEAKVMSEMSLKDLEAMVENDDRVMNAPQGRIIIIPRPKNIDGQIDDQDRDAIIIERKPKKPYKQVEEGPKYRSKFMYKQTEEAQPKMPYKQVEEGPEYRFDSVDFDSGIRRSSYEPNFEFQSAFRHEEEFPSLFKLSDLETAASSPVRQFYESVVESVLSKQNFGLASDPFEALHIAGSEDVPQYKPRFDYDAYSKDSTETKLQGKPYWKDTPERREEMIDENGCRTIIKKVVDPEDEKKPNSGKAKSVVITKECESPNLNGPDAKIMEARPLRLDTSRFDSEPSFGSYDAEPSSYESTRPEELSLKKSEVRDPLASDYIDSMLEKHFKSFPGFSNPLSSFRGYQERFKLRAPEAFKNVKPTVSVKKYEYSHPKSGFDDERQQDSVQKDSTNDDSPRVYEHHYNYDYPENTPRKLESSEYDDDSKEDSKASNPKDPKMMKKSFAYYRKDNPKSDPDDQQYAEEYGTGNYRSFSSSYDSEKDGPKKKQ